MTRLLGTLIAALALFVLAPPAVADGGGHHHKQKVTICHQTSAENNLYIQIRIPARQLAYGYGHGDHEGDIWAAFTYYRPGPNIDVAAQGDQATLANECVVSVPEPPVDPPVVDQCPPANLFNGVRGTHGNDVLVGTRCRDIVAGFSGNDLMWGLGERDLMVGGRGSDRLVGGEGRDALRGGFENDRLVATDGAPGDRLVGGVGRDVCVIDPGDRVFMCERVVIR